MIFINNKKINKFNFYLTANKMRINLNKRNQFLLKIYNFVHSQKRSSICQAELTDNRNNSF